MNRRSHPHKVLFITRAVTGAILACGVISCSAPPSRSYEVNVGSKDAIAENPPEGNPPAGTGSPIMNQTPPVPNTPATPIVTTPVIETPMTPTTPSNPISTPTTPGFTECTNKLSVGRIHQWHATNEGVMIPSQGLIVIKEGDKNVAKVEFVGEGWHVVPVWLKNAYEAEVDLSKSKNFTITYSATNDLWVQLRPSFAWSGGDKWAAKIPSTEGASKTLVVSFEDAAMWSAPLGQPAHSLNEARAKARGFVFVGNKPAKFAVTSLVIDGYTPPCE